MSAQESNDFSIKAVGQIAINVRDLTRATAFYRDVLRMKLLFEVPKMAFFDCAGVRLMLAVAESGEFDHPASILYYRVDQIQNVAEILKAQGVNFLSAPHVAARLPQHELWLGFFRDSEGNTLALMEEVPQI